MSIQDRVRFEFSLITITLSVEQSQSEERIIEGRTVVEKRKKIGKRVTIIVLILAQSLILGSVSYTGLSLLYWSQSISPISQITL